MKKEVLIGITGLIGIFSFFYDKEIILFFENLRFLDVFFIFILFLSNFFVFLSFVFILFLKKRDSYFSLFLTVISGWLLSYFMKISIKRLRPFQENIVNIHPVMDLLNVNHLSYSFPSAHAMIVFSIYPLLREKFKKIKYYWFLFAILVSLSRIYFNVHYLSDVIIGGLIGYLIGELFLYLKKNKKINL